jgi:nucleotide-binding universal stress UspA family protein
MFTRILVPTDFSEPSDAALEYARTLAARFGASLHLLHILEHPVSGAFGGEAYLGGSPALDATLRAEAEAAMAARLPDAERTRLRATAEIVEGPATATIVEYAQARQISLIVMGTHGRTGLAHALLGSVSEHVVRVAPCPVLTVHAMPVAIAAVDRSWSAVHAPA